jgi:hypothetical protein
MYSQKLIHDELLTVSMNNNPNDSDENDDLSEEILRRMERRYFKYFQHWKDFEMLTCILAMIGLILALIEVRSKTTAYYLLVRIDL